MFDISVFLTTVQKVAFLLCFIGVGYLMRRSGKLGRDACTSLSVLATYIFAPAYSILSLAENFTVVKLGTNLKIIGFSVLFLVIVVVIANVLGKLLARNDLEKRSLIYILAFTNNGYFGLPVIQGVFGSEVLAQFIVFCVPFNIAICSYGYALFSSEKGFDWKKALFSPVMIATMLGCVIGLTGFKLPGFVHDAVAGAMACMSPASMLLAGLVLGAFSLKQLLSGVRPYLMGLLRLVGLTVLVGVPMYLIGIRGIYLFLALALQSLPAGLNCIVYPESFGHDSSENAKLCFVSVILSIATLPVIFAILPAIAGPLS